MSEHDSKQTVPRTEPAPNTAPDAGGEERRGWIRYPITAAAELTEVRTRTQLVGRASDLGLGGCYVDILNPFPSGTDVRVRLTQGAWSFEALARVVHNKPGMGMGLAFTEIDAGSQAILERWLAGLNGELTPTATSPEASGTTQGVPQNERLVLNDLIRALMDKRVLSDAEGAKLLHRLFH